MSFAEQLRAIASSEQGTRVFSEASKLAKDPAARDRIAAVRRSMCGEPEAVAAPAPDSTPPVA